MRHVFLLASALPLAFACGAGGGSSKHGPASANSAGAGGNAGAGDTGGAAGPGGSTLMMAGTGGSSGGGASTSGSSGTASGSGGAAGTGSAGKASMPPPPDPCPKRGPCTQWENVSPPTEYAYVDLSNYGFQTVAGAMADARKTVYVGTCNHGVWKTTDGADTWTKIDTGTFYNNDGSVYAAPPYDEGVVNPLDAGRNWTMAVDPTNSDVVYTTAGYGVSQSLWRSTNGGVDWTELYGDEGKTTSAVVYTIAINPVDHLHLLTTHVSWVGYDSDAGLQESKDGGATWIPHPTTGMPGDTPTGWGHGQYVFFLGQRDDGSPDTDGNEWIVTTQLDGIWRTSDGSKSWKKVADVDMTHGQESMYRSPVTNALYIGTMGEVYRSLDNGQTWQPTGAQSSSDGYGGIVGDGAHVWAMLSNTGVSTKGPYQWQILPEDDTSSAPDASHWTFYNDQSFQDGPMAMVYDPENHVLYASNWSTGFWRLRL